MQGGQASIYSGEPAEGRPAIRPVPAESVAAPCAAGENGGAALPAQPASARKCSTSNYAAASRASAMDPARRAKLLDNLRRANEARRHAAATRVKLPRPVGPHAVVGPRPDGVGQSRRKAQEKITQARLDGVAALIRAGATNHAIIRATGLDSMTIAAVARDPARGLPPRKRGRPSRDAAHRPEAAT